MDADVLCGLMNRRAGFCGKLDIIDSEVDDAHGSSLN
jgi:hypothetical protein